MANVSALKHDRGQLLLVGAFALSFVLVALALLLNSAVYTENSTTRSDDDTREAIEFSNEVRLAAKGTLSHIERTGGSGFEPAMNDWGDYAARHYLTGDVSVALSVQNWDVNNYQSATIEVTYRSSQIQYVAVIEVERDS